MVRAFCLFMVFLFCQTVFCKTLLVSDIDDTLKVSRAQNLFWNVINAYRSGPSFQGMAELYRMLAQDKNVEIVYVTNAHDFFMRWSHKKFLEIHKFPEGEVFFWSKGYKSEHKFSTVNELLKNKNYSLVILVGDNGKEDPVVYKKIEEAYPQIRFVTFIRDLYRDGGTPLQIGAKAFMSSVEVSFELCRMGLVPEAQELHFRRAFNEELRRGRPAEGQIFDTTWTKRVSFAQETSCLK